MSERVKVTQYVRPHGERRTQYVEVGAGVARLAIELVKAGHWFDIEQLQTGHVSMTCDRYDEDGDQITVAHEVCRNEPMEPRRRFEAMVRDAHARFRGEEGADPMTIKARMQKIIEDARLVKVFGEGDESERKCPADLPTVAAMAEVVLHVPTLIGLIEHICEHYTDGRTSADKWVDVRLARESLDKLDALRKEQG